jgi:V/A-type H+-transporting ATPase subunit D
MAIRTPPGRAGRLWLLRRLETARRGADVLEQKRRTLLRERRRLSERLAETEAEWERLAAAAAEWNARAAAAAGQRRLRLAALHRPAKAGISLTRRNVLGVVVPVEATVQTGGAPDFVALGGASVALAAQAHAEALSAAAAYAAARTAHEAITAELQRTARRLRAIEHRWIPAHEAALRKLELELDESELADIARTRWASERGRGARR